jgi:hypothetical protein
MGEKLRMRSGQVAEPWSLGKRRLALPFQPRDPRAEETAGVDAPPAKRTLRLTPLAALLLVAAMYQAIGSWADYDIFWHLSNGRLWVEKGIFPSPDRFSWSAFGQPVASHSVLFDRLSYLLWDFGGGTALAIFAALLFIGALMPFALLLGRLGLSPIIEALALIFLTLALLPYRGARPHLLGVILFGLLVVLCERPFGRRKGIACGVILALWLNVHGFFLVGFMLVGCALVVWALAGDRPAATSAGVALVVGAAGTLFSPIGVEVWLLPFRISSNALLKYNQDWASLRPFTPGYAPMGLLIFAAAALGIWRRSDPRSLAALVLILPTIQYARFIPLAAPLLMIVVLERLTERFPRLVVNPLSEFGRAMADRRLDKLAVAMLLVGTVAVGSRAPAAVADGTFYSMPEAAVDQLIACGAPGPVWNHYDWGGYLLWRGNAQFSVVIDGRAETLYPMQVFEDYFSAAEDQTKWKEILQASPAQYLLFPRDASLPFESIAGWHVVYTDDIAVLAMRDTAVWTC